MRLFAIASATYVAKCREPLGANIYDLSNQHYVRSVLYALWRRTLHSRSMDARRAFFFIDRGSDMAVTD